MAFAFPAKTNMRLQHHAIMNGDLTTNERIRNARARISEVQGDIRRQLLTIAFMLAGFVASLRTGGAVSWIAIASTPIAIMLVSWGLYHDCQTIRIIRQQIVILESMPDLTGRAG